MSFLKKLMRFTQPEEEVEPKEGSSGDSSPAGNGSLVPGDLAIPPTVEEAAPAEVELEICLETDPGSVRTNNEDRCLSMRPPDLEVAARMGTLLIVADGMGGASAGEVASEMAIRIIPELYFNSSKPPAVALKEALESASSSIHGAAQTDPELRGMGTTCVAISIIGSEVYLAYVGDSRLYLLRQNAFYQLTEDHSVVVEMVRQGVLTREQARHHEERNVLSLSMGGRPEITASHWESPMTVREGDRLLLCTDGLHDLVADSEMQSIITDSPAHEAVKNLIAAAKREGGHDNITAALVHVRAKVLEEKDCRATREALISSV